MFTKNYRFFFFFLALAIFIGCGQAKRDYSSLILRTKHDPSTLDPAYIVDVISGSISAKLYNGLVLLDPEMNIAPDTAQEWTISEDNTTYTFFLKKGIKFSNDRELKAADFKYSFERILSPKTASSRKWLFNMIKGAPQFIEGKTAEVPGIKILNEYTLEITLNKPFSLFLTFLTMPNAYVVPKEEIEKLGKGFSNQPCGTGPFILSSWKHDNTLQLKANQHYFGRKPRFKKIIYKIIPEDLAAVSLFNRGDIDILEIPRSEFKTFKNNPEWEKYIAEQLELNTYYLGMNCLRPPFVNLKVRQAVNYAIDTEKIIHTILEDRAFKSHGPIPPGLKGYLTANKKYHYDVVKAKQLLKEAGLEQGFKIKLYQNADKEVLSITSVIQHYLKQVNIEAEIIQRDWSAFKEAINKGEADMFYLSWWADYPDAENFLFPVFHSKNFGSLGNRAFFKDISLDKSLEKIHMISEPKQRVLLYNSLEKNIIESAPWVFLWHRKSYIVHQPRIKNYKTYPLYNMDKGLNIEIEKI